MSRRTRPAVERFLEKVSKAPSGCWIWLGAHQPRGRYGYFHWDGKPGSAHRFSYHHFKGGIPDGKVIDHLCRVPRCVNPLHLDAVDQAANLRRALTVTAINAAKRSCPQGHPYDEANTYFRANGSRQCRACSREQARVAYARKRAMA